MKNLILLISCLFVLVSCQKNNEFDIFQETCNSEIFYISVYNSLSDSVHVSLINASFEGDQISIAPGGNKSLQANISNRMILFVYGNEYYIDRLYENAIGCEMYSYVVE